MFKIEIKEYKVNVFEYVEFDGDRGAGLLSEQKKWDDLKKGDLFQVAPTSDNNMEESRFKGLLLALTNPDPRRDGHVDVIQVNGFDAMDIQ